MNDLFDIKPITVPGTLNSLEYVRDYILNVSGAAGLDKSSTNRLRLAVDEIATNIVTHGYADSDLTGKIFLQACMDEKYLTIFIEDASPAYEPNLTKALQEKNLPLEERPIGGLGLYLAVNSVDKLVYERIDDRNRHVLIMKRTKA